MPPIGASSSSSSAPAAVPNFISEDQIEQTLLQKLQHARGYDVLDRRQRHTGDLAQDDETLVGEPPPPRMESRD